MDFCGIKTTSRFFLAPLAGYTDAGFRALAVENGAALVTVGSVAATQPELFLEWLQKYGAARLILGADVKNGLISINGWKEESREKSAP